MQASSAEIVNEAQVGDSNAKSEMQGAGSCGRIFPRGRGRGGNPPRWRESREFCKTQIEERSENELGSI